jgi:hypothetical protein
MQDRIDGATLLLFNTFAICMMIPVGEHFGGRSLPPGVEWIFFSVGAIGLAVLGLFRLGLWLLHGRRRGWQ